MPSTNWLPLPMNSNAFTCFNLHSAHPVPQLDIGYQYAMDGLNECRTARVAEVLSDFREAELFISSVPIDLANDQDYYTEGWSLLRQCAADGRFILACAADTSIPSASNGQAEREKAELQQIMLDAYSRRHEAHKTVLKQRAAQRWISARQNILRGMPPNASTYPVLATLDDQLRLEIGQISDQAVYDDLMAADVAKGRWTLEDPSLERVLQWVWVRR